MKKTIQIPEGNEFSLFIPFVVFSKSGREDANAALWNNLQVVVRMSNKSTDIPHTTNLQEQYVVISFDNSLKLGSYDVIISGEYEGRNVSAPLNNLFSVTNWADGNYAEFVVGQPIECPTQTIIGQFNTTQDIIDLTEELRAALAAAEAAKEEYEEKVEELSNVAQQGNNPDATNTAILTAIGNISIDTTTIAKQGTNASATLTATQTAATNAYASAEAAKTATVDGNDTAVGVAKEIRGEVGTGSDTAAETGTLFAVVKWVKDKVKSIFNLIGSPATGQPATLFAAIAAGGGGGDYPAIDAELAAGKQAIVTAINDRGGSSTTSESLGELADDIGDIAAVLLNGSTFNSPPTDLADAILKLRVLRTKVSGEFYPSSFNINRCLKLGQVCQDLVGVDMPYVTRISNNMLEPATSNIKFAIIPLASTFNSGNVGGYNPMGTNTIHALRMMVAPTNGLGAGKLVNNAATFSYLYYLKFGYVVTGSIDTQMWKPITATNTTTSLLQKEEWDDPNEPTETFTTNLDKFLWYFRNHFMPCFGDAVAAGTTPTLTLNSVVYNVITQEADINTYFSTNGWTLASVTR